MAKHPTSCWRKPPRNWSKRRCREEAVARSWRNGLFARRPFNAVMPGHSRPKDGVASARLCPGIHVFFLDAVKTRVAGTSPAMTEQAARAIISQGILDIAGIALVADLSGALFWEEQ